MNTRHIISNARVVTPDADFDGSVVIEGQRIADILPGRHFPEGLDAQGRWLTPGVIDLHTDYFEKEVAPRPSAEFPLELAFHFMDQRALACGLTTVLGAVRISSDSEKDGSMWRRNGLELARRYETLASQARARHLMHIRWDTNFEPAQDKIEALKAYEHIGNIVFNENIPGQRQFRDLDELARKMAERRGVSVAEGRAMLEEKIRANQAINNRALVRDAFAGRIPLGSHDDTTVEHVIEARDMGCTICEMPTTMDAALQARELGMHIVMGAPNYYRGGSHCGNLSCPEALERGLVDVLCSDYHFPSLLGSAVKMFEQGHKPNDVVNLFTRNAARALNRDKELGSIEVGKLADLILFSPHSGYAEVSHTWIGGRLVFQIAQALARPRAEVTMG